MRQRAAGTAVFALVSSRRLTRRRLVGAGVAVGGVAAIGRGAFGLTAGAIDGRSIANLGRQSAYVEPPVRASVDGLLDTTLEAAPQVGGPPGRLHYEGAVPGPTLLVRPGDTLRVTLTNNLGGGMTNLHVHGMHVSPRDNGDNVFVEVEDGESFRYEYAIPDNHPAGLYWYHPHHHGNSMQQVAGGLAGAIVVAGGLDELEGMAGLTQRLLILQGPYFGQGGVSYLVNGQPNPTLEIRPGETQRWRILNASANAFFNLRLDNHQLHPLAADGVPLPTRRTVDTLLLGPGERADVLVQGGEIGDHAVRSAAWGEGGQAQRDFLVATLNVAGQEQAPASLPTNLLPIDDLRDAALDSRRIVTFEERTSDPYFAIDGLGFDPDRVDQVVKLGATEEWVIRNTSPDWHPFHIHVNDFQVISVNGEPVTPHYEDTVLVPAQGEVVIRMRFLDFTGKFVYHCHILAHEDGGMMGVVEVVE